MKKGAWQNSLTRTDSDLMELPIRKDYYAEEGESAVDQLETLDSKRIVDTVLEDFVCCPDCGNVFLVDSEFKRNGSVSCCNKTLFIKQKKTRRRIIRLNYQEIIRLISNKLEEAFGKQHITFDKYTRVWKIKTDGSQIAVLIQDLSSASSLLLSPDEPFLCVYLEGDKLPLSSDITSGWRFVYLCDTLLDNKIQLRSRANALDYNKTARYSQLESKFDSYLKKITYTQFEKEFVPAFIEGIKEKNPDLERLYLRLETASATFINAKPVMIGGPAQSDFYLINLLEYLKAGLRPEKFGEAKRYYTTKFTFGDYSTAIGHSNDKDVLFIVSTNNIQPEVWAKVAERRSIENRYKHVLLDADVILFLIYNLGLENIIT